MRNLQVSIRVDFPALDNLVAYLREQLLQQKEIDAITARLNQSTQGLHDSSTALQEAADSVK